MKNLKNTLKKIITGVALTAATVLPAQAQNSNIELMQTKDQSTSRVRPNLFYELPGDVKGYTFAEFYEDGGAYLAKSSLNKNLKGSLDAQLQVVNGSGFTDQAGLGVDYKIPTGDNTFAKVKALPVYVGFDGKRVQNKAVIGFYVDRKVYVPVLKDIHVVAFSEINLAAKDGPAWSYGEIHAQKSLDDFVVGLGLDLSHKDGLVPDPHVSVKLGYVFGQD